MMQIRTRTYVSLDGYVSMPNGKTVQLAPACFHSGRVARSPLIHPRLRSVVMGRSTFLPALGAPNWLWTDVDVFVLTSQPLPPGAPAHIVASQGGPAGWLGQLCRAGFDGDIHLVRGPQTIPSVPRPRGTGGARNSARSDHGGQWLATLTPRK
jgi:hypothetical protein